MKPLVSLSGKNIWSQAVWKKSKYLTVFLKREPFLYTLFLCISTRLLLDAFLFRNVFWRYIDLIATFFIAQHGMSCPIPLQPGKLPLTQSRSQLSNSVVMQLTYSYTPWNISSRKWQVSAKVHRSHIYIITHVSWLRNSGQSLWFWC